MMASVMRFFRKRFGRRRRHNSEPASFDVTENGDAPTDPPPKRFHSLRASLRLRRRPKVGESGDAGAEGTPLKKSWSLRRSFRRSRQKKKVEKDEEASPNTAGSTEGEKAAEVCERKEEEEEDKEGATTIVTIEGSPIRYTQSDNTTGDDEGNRDTPPSEPAVGEQDIAGVSRVLETHSEEASSSAEDVREPVIDSGGGDSLLMEIDAGLMEKVGEVDSAAQTSVTGQDAKTETSVTSSDPKSEHKTEETGLSSHDDTKSETSLTSLDINIENVEITASTVSITDVSSEEDSDIFLPPPAEKEAEPEDTTADVKSPTSSVMSRVRELEAFATPPSSRMKQKPRVSESDATWSSDSPRQLHRQRSKSESDTDLLGTGSSRKPKVHFKLEPAAPPPSSSPPAEEKASKKDKKKKKKKDKKSDSDAGPEMKTTTKKKSKGSARDSTSEAEVESEKVKSKKQAKAEKKSSSAEKEGKRSIFGRSKTERVKSKKEFTDGQPSLLSDSPNSSRPRPKGRSSTSSDVRDRTSSTSGATAIPHPTSDSVVSGRDRLEFSKSLPLHTPPVLPEVDEDEDEEEASESDDEKGGTIKFKPLRHVSLKEEVNIDDETVDKPLIEYVFIIALKQDKSKKLRTETTYTFPPAGINSKDTALQAIPQFCFPDIDQWKPTTHHKSETFSFVLTDIEGNRRYGYCRRLLPSGSGARLPEVYCVVSALGCFSLYSKILNVMEERRAVGSAAVFTFLKAIVANPFPKPGKSVQVRVISTTGGPMDEVKFTRPLDSRLEHVDFSLLFNTLSPRKIVQIFSSMLMERRIILAASSLSLISSCGHALLALLYPFEWQHVFIPVLPSNLIDFVCSPLPYLIGMNPACIKQLDSIEGMEEALVVDLDKKKFVRKIGDETSILPSKLFEYLKHRLSSSAISSEYSKPASRRDDPCRADEIIVDTFMTFFVYLYGDYKEFLMRKRDTRRLEFQKADFIKKFSSKSTQRFLDAFQMTQMFDVFIDQRENPAKAAILTECVFEKQMIGQLRQRSEEIEVFSSKSSSRFGKWKRGFTKRK